MDQFYYDIIKIFIHPENLHFWGNLFQTLGQNLSCEGLSLGVIKKLLMIVLGLSKKYEYSQRSEILYSEISDLVLNIGDPLLKTTQQIMSQIMSGQSDQQTLQVLELILRIFYKLICQDIPQKFDDNLEFWVSVLKQIIDQSFDSIVTQTFQSQSQIQDVQNIVFRIKGEVVKIALLFTSRYADDFQDWIQSFANQIWVNCVSLI